MNPSMHSTLQAALEQHGHKEGALLPILHAIQDALGYIPETLIPELSQATQRSRAEIHGVISFYSHFKTTPPAALVLEICRAEACQARGAESLIAHAKQKLGCDFDQTSQDGTVDLAPTYCLGLCSQGPAAMLNGKPVAHLNSDRLDSILANAEVQS